MTEHIMANVYEAQRLAKELRRAIAAARRGIAVLSAACCR
jgi:hypothetical protein